MNRYCKNCGNKLQGHEKFCPVCGNKIQPNIITPQNSQCTGTPKKKTIKKIMILSVSCLLLIGIFLIFIFLSLYPKTNNKSTPLETNSKKTNELLQEKEVQASNEQKNTEKEPELTNKVGEPAQNIQGEKNSSTETENAYISPESNSTKNDSPDQIHTLALKYYGDFLEYYKSQETSGFSDGPGELINEMFFSQAFFPDGFKNSGITLYYTVIDLSKDGVPELFISDKETIYDAYGIMETEGQIWPLFGDSSMGNRTHYTICENNLILCEGSSGADYNSIAYYQIEPHAYTATCSEAIVQDGPKYYFATEDSYGFSYISEANQNDYESFTTHHLAKEDIQWLKLSEF